MLFHSAAKDQLENDFGTYHDHIIRSKTKAKSVDKPSKYILNKNILGLKKYEANKKQPYLFVTKSFDIS